MNKRRIKLICMILIMTLCISCINVPMTSDVAKAESSLYLLENTSYGVEDTGVVAKKLVLKDDNTEIIDIKEPDLLVIKDNVSNTTVKLYLLGNKGILKDFELSPKDEWIKNLTSTSGGTRSIESISYNGHEAFDEIVDRYEDNIPFEYEDSLKKILNPETGKYDLLNVSSGKYYSYGYDDINSSSYDLNYDANFIPYRMGEYYGFLNKQGEKISDAKFKTTNSLQNGVLLCYTEDGSPDGKFSIVTSNGKFNGNDLYENISAVDSARVLAVREGKSYLINIKTGESELTEDIGKAQTWKLLTKKGTQDGSIAYSFVKCESVSAPAYDKACFKTYLTTTAGTMDLNTILGGDYCDCTPLGGYGQDESRKNNLAAENYVYVEAYSLVDDDEEIEYFYQGIIDCYGNKVYGTTRPVKWDTDIIDFCGQYGIISTYLGTVSTELGTIPNYKIQAIQSIDNKANVYYEASDVRGGLQNYPFKLRVVGDYFCFYAAYEKKYILVNGNTGKVTELNDLTEYDNARLQFDETLRINGQQYVLFYDGVKATLMNLDAEQGKTYTLDTSAEIIKVKENKKGNGLIYIRSTDKNTTVILNEKLNEVFKTEKSDDDRFNPNSVEYITNSLTFMYGDNIYDYNGKLISSIKKQTQGMSKEGIFRGLNSSETGDKNYAYYDLSGKKIIKNEYRYCSDFYHNIACVYDGYSTGIINTNGKLLISIDGFTYNDETNRFWDYYQATAGEGIILQGLGANYYFYDFSKLDFPEKGDSTESGDNTPGIDTPPINPELYIGGKEPIFKKLSLGEKTGFTIPESVPVIGGGEISFDFGEVPVQFDRDGNYFRIGVGINDWVKLKKDGWSMWKKFIETQKDEYKKGFNSLLASKFGTASMGMSVKPKISVFGYAEGTISANGITWRNFWNSGKIIIEMKVKASQEWQEFVVAVPVVIKVTGEVGLKETISVWLDFNNAELELNGKCEVTLPKIKPSFGVGISHIFDISVYGSIDNQVTLSSGKITSASATGELGVSAKALFASYEKAIIDGTLEYYPELKRKTKTAAFSEKNNDWNISVDDTKATAWNMSTTSNRKKSSGTAFTSTTLQTDIYDNSCARLLKTDAGVYVLSYIAATTGRTTGNQYAAVYSIYDPTTKSWSEPVLIDDDGTADFYLNSVVDGNDIYFTWSNLNAALSDTDIKNLDVDKAASMTEIEVAKLELDSNSNKVTKKIITQNEHADIMPALYVGDENVYIGWCENVSNHLLDMSGTNIIHMGSLKDLEFSETAVKKISNPVRAIAIGEVNHTVQTAYIENTKDMNNINSITENGESLSIVSTDDNIMQISYDTIGGNKAFLWYAQNNENSCIYMNDGSSTNVLVENIDLNSCYDVLNESDRDIIVTSSTADSDDKSSKIIGYLIQNGASSDSIKLMETTGEVSDFSLVNYEDSYMLLYTNGTANIEKESVDVTTNLCVATISDEDRTLIESVSYLDENIVPNGECTVTVEVKNNGFDNTDGNTAVVVYCDKTEVGRTQLSNILSGTSETLHVNLKLPQNMAQGAKLLVQVERNGAVLDSEDSIVGLTDIGLSVEEAEESAVVKISNESAYATNAVLDIYDADTDGIKLASYDLGSIGAGENIEKKYDISKYADANVESLAFVISTDAKELFECNNTASLYIGKNKLNTLDHINATKSVVNYKTGDKLSVNDLNIYAVYTDDSSELVTDYTTNVDSINMSEPGSKSLIITYEEVGIIRSVTVPITVTKAEESSGTNNGNTGENSTNGGNTNNNNTNGNSTNGSNTSNNNANGNSANGSNTSNNNTNGNSTNGSNADNSNTNGNSTNDSSTSNNSTDNSNTNSDNTNGSDINDNNTNDDNANNSGTNKNTTVKKPGKVTGLKVKNKKKKTMVVLWNWSAKASGFQIQYAQNKKFTKKKKIKNVGKWISQKKISKLKKGKTYYVRVRAYKKSSRKKIYGKWSKIKKITIRK